MLNLKDPKFFIPYTQLFVEMIESSNISDEQAKFYKKYLLQDEFFANNKEYIPYLALEIVRKQIYYLTVDNKNADYETFLNKILPIIYYKIGEFDIEFIKRFFTLIIRLEKLPQDTDINEKIKLAFDVTKGIINIPNVIYEIEYKSFLLSILLRSPHEYLSEIKQISTEISNKTQYKNEVADRLHI